MSLLTSQEKNLTIFLLSNALIGSVIGIFRHNWLGTPEILLSPKNLPSYIKEIEEDNIIEEHNTIIKERSQPPNATVISTKSKIGNNSNIDSKSIQNITVKSVENKTESNKKKITQNTSEIININIASKEDFMTLPYIGEVKAGRIIDLRNEMGTFISIKDLEKSKGNWTENISQVRTIYNHIIGIERHG